MRFAVISANESLRLLLSQYLAIEWPDVEIQEYDCSTQDFLSEDIDWKKVKATLLDESAGGNPDLGLLTQLQAHPDCPPIIYLIDEGHEGHGIAAMELGAIDYLRKNDISRAALMDAVKVAVKARASGTVRVSTVLDFTLPGQQAFYSPSRARAFRYKDTGKSIVINGYNILRELGNGGMSTVFLAERRSDHLQLALKILDNNLKEDDVQLMRFIQEYGIIAKFTSPYVVRIYDQGFTDDHIYIAMEYFSGGDLKARLGRALRPESAVSTLYQIARALSAIHDHGVIHSDLKPQNIMFRSSGELAIVDFGIAKELAASENTSSSNGQVMGTPYYMSPEQGMGIPIDARSDLYSLGVIFYELLMGIKPYRANSPMMVLMMHRQDPIPRLPRTLDKFQDVVDRLLAKHPDDRFSSANELIEYLVKRWASNKAKAALA